MKNYDSIPVELTELNQWCCFVKEWIPERQKFTKKPINPATGYMAKSNDPSTWVDFDTAVEHSPAYDGIGFFFNGEHYGVDLDNCESEILRYQNNDTENNIVADFIETLTSYAEVSPSGKGVHIICKGQLPPGGRRKNDVEMYDNGRFFTMTGNKIGDYFGVFDDTGYGKINYLHHKYIGETTLPVEALSALETGTTDLSIEEIIDYAKKSKNGERFINFLEGNGEENFSSLSEADLSFCNDLAFWCSKDIEKMDAIFRRSSLYRQKWDTKRGDTTYGELTLRKAISSCTDVFNPPNAFTLKISDEALKGAKKPQKAFSYDDTGNAQRFLYTFGDNVLYSYNDKCWYYYANKFWAEDRLGKIYEMTDYIADNIRKEPVFVSDPEDEELVKEAQKSLQRHCKYTRNHKGKENMLKDVQHHVSVLPTDFDQHELLFNVQNGYIDLANGHLMEHQKSKRFTKISYAEYKEECDCPLWKKFLNETFLGDQELIDYLQCAIGYSMSAETTSHKMFILLGDGCNGKSVMLNVLNEVFGTYALNIQPQTIGVKTTPGVNSDIARLKGARFVTTSEPNRGLKLDEGIVKQITGGDKITARFLYGREFEFKAECKIWMATNYKPIISGTDHGIWRRLVLIPFNNKIPQNKIDEKLVYKLTAELSGILNWCIEGYQAWRKHGLIEPDIIKELRKEYRAEMDTIQNYIDDRCVANPDHKLLGKDLWNDFKDWENDTKEYSYLSTKGFYAEIGKYFQKKKTKHGITFYGVALKPSGGYGKCDDYLKLVQ